MYKKNSIMYESYDVEAAVCLTFGPVDIITFIKFQRRYKVVGTGSCIYSRPQLGQIRRMVKAKFEAGSFGQGAGLK